MILGVCPKLTSQFVVANKKSNTGLSAVNYSNNIMFGQGILTGGAVDCLVMEASPKARTLFEKILSILSKKEQELYLQLDTVERGYINSHPEAALKLGYIEATDINGHKVNFTLKNTEGDYEVTQLPLGANSPVTVKVQNGFAQVWPKHDGDSIDIKDPNKYLEWGLEALCAAA